MTRLAPRSRTLLTTVLTAVLLVLLAAAPSLRAAVQAPTSVVERTVALDTRPRAGSAAAAELQLPIRADMIGATWAGSARGLELRAAGADGRWSRWIELDAGGDGPDPGSSEARALHGRRALAVPLWVGDAERVAVRVRAGHKIGGVRLSVLNVSGTATRASRAATTLRRSAARVLGVTAPGVAQAMPAQPGITRRSSWGAIEARSAPIYADRAVGVVVHHTDTPNGYACSQVPSLLRGIQRYHERTLGWNDIGYNFVVDRCGGVWEGRGGGITRAVIGAHTMGFNTGTVGIAILGTHSTVAVSAAATRALARLIAWRMDLAHVVPSGSMSLQARSSDKFPVGTHVTLPAVSGHRDLYPTACPGKLAYGTLRALAKRAAATGGLKVANITTGPSIDPASGALTYVRVRATSNSPSAQLTLSVVRASDGLVLAAAHPTGRVGVLRFSSSLADAPKAWDVRIRVEARLPGGQTARPYDEPLATYSSDPGFTLTTAPAAAVAPGGDPSDDAITFSYTMATRARLGVWLYDPTTLSWLRTLQPATVVAASTEPVAVTVPVPTDLADGDYQLRIGVEDDTAPGRSMWRFALHVTRGT